MYMTVMFDNILYCSTKIPCFCTTVVPNSIITTFGAPWPEMVGYVFMVMMVFFLITFKQSSSAYKSSIVGALVQKIKLFV